MFHCPNCNGIPLSRLNSDQGVMWVCDRCHGRAVALALLRPRVNKQFMNQLWQLARGAKAPGRLPEKSCPACRKHMVEITTRGVSAALALDVCKTCQFIWFDAQETAQLPILPTPASEPELSPEAREALALAKIDIIRRRAEADGGGEMPESWWHTLLTLLGMPVEENAPAVEKHPWVTWTLAFAMTAITVLTMLSGDMEGIIKQFGLIPAEAGRYGGLTLLMSFFLHGGVLHLLGNLYFLLTFGDNVEDYLGPLRFLLLVAAASFVGDIAHIAFNPDSTVPCVGASGGISGIIAYYALRFPHVRLVLCWRWMLVIRWFRISAMWALALWIGLQLYGAWEQWAGFSSVSAAAHLGGAAAGAVFYLVTRLSEPRVHSAIKEA